MFPSEVIVKPIVKQLVDDVIKICAARYEEEIQRDVSNAQVRRATVLYIFLHYICVLSL